MPSAMRPGRQRATYDVQCDTASNTVYISSTVCLNHHYCCRHYQHCCQRQHRCHCQYRRRAGITPLPPLPSSSMSANTERTSFCCTISTVGTVACGSGRSHCAVGSAGSPVINDTICSAVASAACTSHCASDYTTQRCPQLRRLGRLFCAASHAAILTVCESSGNAVNRPCYHPGHRLFWRQIDCPALPSSPMPSVSAVASAPPWRRVHPPCVHHISNILAVPRHRCVRCRLRYRHCRQGHCPHRRPAP